jgi:hypothetical protein
MWVIFSIREYSMGADEHGLTLQLTYGHLTSIMKKVGVQSSTLFAFPYN